MMDKFHAAIKAKDWVATKTAIAELSEQAKYDQKEIIAVIDALPLLVSTFPETSPNQFSKGTTWHGYEWIIWEIGEVIRKILKNHRDLRKSPDLMEAIEQICSNPMFGKGRESFVMLLGRYGDSKQVPALKRLLKDDEVHGHAVYALRALGASEAREDIGPFLNHPKRWVRDQAKRYFDKIQKKQP